MAIAYVASSNVGPGSGTSATISKPTGTAENDIMLMAVYVEPASVTPSGTDISAWTQFLSVTHGTYDMKMVWYWKRAGASEQTSYTVTLTSATWRQLQIISHSGCVTSGSPIDVSNSGTANDPATTVTATGVTTTVDNAMLVMQALDWGSVTWSTWSSPLTERLDSGQMAHASGIQATAGASGNKSVTADVGGHKIALLCALKPSTSTAITIADTLSLSEVVSITTTLSPSDALTLSEAFAVTAQIGVADGLSLAEVLTVTATLGVAEGLALAEAFTVTVTLDVADPLLLAEAVSIATGGTPITVADTLALGEAFTITASVAVAEGMALADAFAVAVAASVAEALGLTEIIVTGKSVLRWVLSRAGGRGPWSTSGGQTPPSRAGDRTPRSDPGGRTPGATAGGTTPRADQ